MKTLEQEMKAAKSALNNVNSSTQEFLLEVFKALDLNGDGTVEIDEMIAFFMQGQYVSVPGTHI